jgi:uncharacterized protein (TIRG00374 family)
VISVRDKIAKRQMTKNILKIIVSLAVSVVAGYLAFRNVQLNDVIAGIRQADLVSVAIMLVLIAGAQILRSSRWGLLLEPLESLSQRLLLPITCIGFLFVWILPARLGELARPYLLQQNSKVGLSPAMGSVVLERLIDSTFLVVLLTICLPVLRLPGVILSAFKGFAFILLAAVLLLLLGSIPPFREKLFRVVSIVLPSSWSEFLTRIADTFYSGMQAIMSVKRLLFILALTLVIWAANLAAFLVLFRSMHLNLGLLAGATVLVLTCLGIALPAAPGFIGNYHYACIVALGLFGVAKDTALAYAILIHFLTLAVLVAMGLFFINFSKLKVSFSLRSAIESPSTGPVDELRSSRSGPSGTQQN